MGRKTTTTLRYLAVIYICLLCLIPFYVLMVLALNAPSRVFYHGNVFVPDFYWRNFVEAWQKSLISVAMINSAIITFGTLSLAIILGGMGGYAIARYNTRLNRYILAIFIGCMMIPGIINTVPLYTLMRQINAINTLWGMVMVCSSLAMPSAIFIYTTFIKALPRELDEAAAIDGYSGIMTFWRVIFPIIKPATASFVILNGFGIWNNYAQAVFFLQSKSKQNIPQALSIFFQQFAGAHWNIMAATAVIAIIPLVVVFLIFQRQFISGLSEGAVKG